MLIEFGENMLKIDLTQAKYGFNLIALDLIRKKRIQVWDIWNAEAGIQLNLQFLHSHGGQNRGWFSHLNRAAVL